MAKQIHLSNRSVLLVEDNVDNQQITSCILEDDGYHVCCADSAEEALELLECKDFDLILMDINLPGMNGTEAVQKIRGTQHLKHIPVAALTSEMLKAELEQIFASGVDDILTRPLDGKILIKRVNQLLSRDLLSKDENLQLN